ncbi:ribonuclease H-like domain-containing protein [Tanacetum coccineum]
MVAVSRMTLIVTRLLVWLLNQPLYTLSIAVCHNWLIHQLDVKNAFVHGHLSETVYLHQPLSSLLVMLPALVFGTVKLTLLYLYFIVVVTLLTCCSMWMISRLQLRLQLSYNELLLRCMSTYVEENLERAHMQKCNPCRTPVNTESKLGVDCDPVSDPTLYQSLVGVL